MPRYRVTWDGYVSGSSDPTKVSGPYLNEDRFWHDSFRDGAPLRKFQLWVDVIEVKEGAQAQKGRHRRPTTPKDESR